MKRTVDSWSLGECSVACGDSTSKETSLLERRLFSDTDNRVLGHNSVLRESGTAHLPRQPTSHYACSGI